MGIKTTTAFVTCTLCVLSSAAHLSGSKNSPVTAAAAAARRERRNIPQYSSENIEKKMSPSENRYSFRDKL